MAEYRQEQNTKREGRNVIPEKYKENAKNRNNMAYTMSPLLKIAPNTNKYYLSVSQQRNFRKYKETDPQYFGALQTYLQWFCTYAVSIFGNTTYTEKQIIDLIFKIRSKEPSQVIKRDIIKKHIYLYYQYIQELLQIIQPATAINYKHTIWRIDNDLESLVLLYEAYQSHIDLSLLELTSGVRSGLSSHDICCAAHDLFYIEDNKAINNLYLMDLKPTVTFQVRQMIELYGKRMLGFDTITSNGSVAKQFTQVAWKFIKERNGCSNKWRIEMPFDLDSIVAINNWANGFTHSAQIDSPHLQYFALKTTEALFKPAAQRITIYNGHSKLSMMYSEVKIYGYNALKEDFENYLQPQYKFLFWSIKKKDKFKVIWADIENVDAYIMSL